MSAGGGGQGLPPTKNQDAGYQTPAGAGEIADFGQGAEGIVWRVTPGTTYHTILCAEWLGLHGGNHGNP